MENMKDLKWIVFEDYEWSGQRIRNAIVAFKGKVAAEDFIQLVIPKDVQNRYKIEFLK